MPLVLGLFFIIAAIFVEVSGFIIVGSTIGVVPTLALLLFSTLAGIILLKMQGAGLLARIRRDMDKGQIPEKQLVEGIMVVFASILLIVPGFVSDIFGLALFIPPLRHFLWRHMASHVTTSTKFYSQTSNHKKNARNVVIDLDEDEYQMQANDSSPWRRLEDKKNDK